MIQLKNSLSMAVLRKNTAILYLLVLFSGTVPAIGELEFQQDAGTDGIVSMEAENFHLNTSQSGYDWIHVTTPIGFSGTAAMQAQPDDGTAFNTNYAANSPRLDFAVNFVKTGTHYIWIRAYAIDGFADSCHAGLDGQEIDTADRIAGLPYNPGPWAWTNMTMDSSSRATVEVNSMGIHIVNIWMREDGFIIDKIVLTTNSDYVPSDSGPAESPRIGDTTPPAVPSGLAARASNNIISLNWDNNTESDLAGYNVYRDTVSGGPYTRIASDVLTSNYVDTTAVNGTTYYYVVTAVDNSSNESGNSNEVSATPHIPLRYMENLDRGVVAVYKGGSQVYVGWRMFGTDPANIGFNVYRNSTKINSSPVTGSTNYLDTNGSTSNTYSVAPVIDGIEQGLSNPVAVWSNLYREIPLQRPAEGTTPDGDYDYSPNDASVGDLDGDGQYEIVLKWDPSNSRDNTADSYTGNVYLDAYEIDGTFLWRIDLGINIQAGPHYTQFMVYDLDNDGIAEVVCKTADGTTDGEGTIIGSPTADWRNEDGAILDGPEYLSIFGGQTGTVIDTVDYVPPRGDICNWGDCYGNRVDRFLACIAYLDGKNPSVVMTRGYYEKTVLAAWDFVDGQLSLRWVFDSTDPGNSAYEGQGCHSLSVADVDGDSFDEIVFGACTIDHDGTGLYSTGYGHGDALHVSDMDPSRPGLEVWQCHEYTVGSTYRDAATGELLFHLDDDGDIGRACAAHINPSYPGYQLWSSWPAGIYTTDGTQISPIGWDEMSQWHMLNFLIWWDADLAREFQDATIINKWHPEYNSGDGGVARLLTAYTYGADDNNYTKSTPCLQADILGDWREEVIWRHYNNENLLIFTTTDETSQRLYTLMHDPQYREAIAWQNVGYNQPPHPSFYIGAGMSTPPTPHIQLVGAKFNPADIVEDGRIDLYDFAVLAAQWMDSPGMPSADIAPPGGDGIVDDLDLRVLCDNWLTIKTE